MEGGREAGIYILTDLSVSHIACPAHSFRFTMGTEWKEKDRRNVETRLRLDSKA